MILDEALDDDQTQRVTKKKRCLKLELTDGQSTVIAMEAEVVPSLHKKLPPGTKLLISGPIECSKHILRLKPKNVEVLGGEVDDLLVENCYENMLLKALGKPITENLTTAESLAATRTTQQNPIFSSTQAYIPSQFTARRPPDLNDDDDEIFMQIPAPISAAPPAEMTPPAVQMTPPPVSDLNQRMAVLQSPNAAGSISDDDFEDLDAIINQVPSQPEVPQPITFDSREYKFKVEGRNVLTFAQLAEIPPEKQANSVFIFWPHESTVTRKIQIKNEKWELQVSLSDGSGSELEVGLL